MWVEMMVPFSHTAGCFVILITCSRFALLNEIVCHPVSVPLYVMPGSVYVHRLYFFVFLSRLLPTDAEGR